MSSILKKIDLVFTSCQSILTACILPISSRRLRRKLRESYIRPELFALRWEPPL